MVSQDEYDVLLDRNKKLETENSEIKAKLDSLMKDMAVLTRRLSEFMDKRDKEKIKSKKRKTGGASGDDELVMDTTSVTSDSVMLHTLNSMAGGSNNNSTSNSNGQSSNSKHNDADDSEKNFDDCIWKNVQTKRQYQQNKKQNGNNASESNPTPIQLNKMSFDGCAVLTKSLFTKFHGKGYIFQQIKNGNNPRILTENEQIKKNIMIFLDSQCYEYNSYNNKSERKKSFIIRGFCCNNDSENIDAINTALDSAGIAEFAVTRFRTGFQRSNPSKAHNLLYRIVVDHTVSDETLTNIRTIGFFGVRIEKMRASKVVQCYNCQRFNHTAGQCHFNYRCVQCVDSHGPQQCPRKLNINFPLGCINCHDAKLDFSGHTANDLKNCSFYLNKMAPVINKTANNTTQNTSHSSKSKSNFSNTNSNVFSEKNFASIVRGAKSNANVDPSQIFAIFSQIAEPLSKLCQFFNAQK